MAGSQVKHLDFTLNGVAGGQNIGAGLSAAQLAVLLGSTAAVTQFLAQGKTLAQIAEFYMFKRITMQAHTANTGVIFIGGGQQVVSASSYGNSIPIPVTSIPQSPLVYPDMAGVVMRLTDFTVFGTNNDIIHLLMQEW